jgi:regulator of sigma E protease
MLFTILAGLIGLGIVMFIHETGHFLAAKASGIEVEAFSLGWGRPLLRYTRGGTEYRLSALPLGGYCKLKGEQQLQQAVEGGQDRVADEKGSLFSVSPWKRILTYAAGPFANLLFSILIMTFIWWIGFNIQTYGNKIVLASDYGLTSSSQRENPADAAGLQTGDRIVSIAGRDIETYRDLQETVASRPEMTLPISYERQGELFSSTITPRLNKDTGGGIIGVSPWVDPVIDEVEKNSAADAAGIQAGDRILRADGREITNHLDFISFLNSHPLRFGLDVLRGGTELPLRIIPEYDQNGAPILGISFRELTVLNRAEGPAAALAQGIRESFGTVALSLKSLGLLFRGINLQKAVSGPIRITYMVGQVATYGFSQGFMTGFTSLFRFLSFLSVALFVMNLLPIPALDGGLIVLSLFELLRRRQVSPKVFYRYQIFGFVFIMALLMLTTFSDIFFFFTK